MKIHHLQDTNSVANNFISQLRNIEIQKDKMRFRKNIERLGEILGYELSKFLEYQNEVINTPLGTSNIQTLKNLPVICSILRAGLPLHTGLLNYFDESENAFISAYRHHTNEKDFEVLVEYLASPSLESKTLILADPMLATGKSFVNVLKALDQVGTPKIIHVVAIVAAPEGIDYIKKHFPKNTHLWVAAIDEKLDDRGYIVPGLGDAGDLCFGSKLQH